MIIVRICSSAKIVPSRGNFLNRSCSLYFDCVSMTLGIRWGGLGGWVGSRWAQETKENARLVVVATWNNPVLTVTGGGGYGVNWIINIVNALYYKSPM